jgi:hypothetical protein
MMLEVSDFLPLKEIIEGMDLFKIETLMRHTVQATTTLWTKLPDAFWWRNEKLRRIVLFFYEVHERYPGLPVDTFYLENQEPLMNLYESLVLLRGNQEPRQMSTYINHLFDLKSKAALIELENNIQMRHELQVKNQCAKTSALFVVGCILSDLIRRYPKHHA